ncbi:MAG TPA: tRNA (guanosine(37)-N1)-methyltransferase TrmD [Myxococcota bacterium]|jgi:tRNA (guanine37-N1)-methyltransferase|nr:tRNA (guanosine(37)-N1)-methyltransferase TrmD [Myxococcota bacterium]
MIFDVLTLLPEVFAPYLQASVLGRAMEAGLLAVNVVNIRDHAEGRHRVCDDYPYGGGQGMLMKPEPVAAALDAVRQPGEAVWLLTPQGERFDDAMARALAREPRVLLLCARYEGLDDRVRQLYAPREVSVGDYVLTGGELAALCVIDAAARFLPGVLGNEASPERDTFGDGLLEAPQYTRPREFRGLAVPPVLLDGHHEEIRRWRRLQSLLLTRSRRPDLFAKLALTEEDRALLAAADAQAPADAEADAEADADADKPKSE